MWLPGVMISKSTSISNQWSHASDACSVRNQNCRPQRELCGGLARELPGFHCPAFAGSSCSASTNHRQPNRCSSASTRAVKFCCSSGVKLRRAWSANARMAHLPLLFFLSVMMMDQEGILEIQPSHQLSECDEFDESKVTEVRVYEGEAAVFRFPLSTSSTVFNNYCANTGFKIDWYKNQSDGHLQQPVLWPRISQEGERLWFHPAEFNDTGQYICTVRNGTFCAKIPVWLNVVQRAREICIAEPAGISTLVKIPLEENRIVTCPDIEDFRHPNRNFSVQWFHNCYPHPNWQGDRGIENDKLVIHVMRENYQGNYTCMVTYKFMGRNMSFTRVVTVEPVSPSGLPKNPDIQTPDELHVFTVNLGSLAQLACTVFLPYLSEEQSEPQVWWEIDGHKVNLHGDTRITSMSKVLMIALGDRTIETTLQIQSFNSQDLKRKYTCNAANSRGNVSRKAVIQYEGHPPHIELGCGLGIPLFLVVVLFGLYHLYWLELLLLYRSCFRSNEVLDGKDYDVYISYARNSEEEQFVLLTLRRVLENELGYRVCIFDRDSLPGGTITDETLSFVSRSRRIIVVLSPLYVLRGTQALLELKAGLDSMAQAGDLRVILVQYQPICRSSWAQELRRARVALTLIQWKGEKSADLSSRFWKQLQVELPVRRIKDSVNSSELPLCSKHKYIHT
ncbi:interleukin-1 receptor accessory protein isoform X3 [Paramormyrops kingsleyae]|uniref:interleukin-1 receptor accessory protein isoform X3 n=1 Tax=Paramormyrops kingsleyae TaxID=1676925 RepID=UPI003B973576